MKDIKPQVGYLLNWREIGEWINGMSEQEKDQPAFVYTSEFQKSDGYFSTEQKLIGATGKDLGTARVPRLVGQTADLKGLKFKTYRNGSKTNE